MRTDGGRFVDGDVIGHCLIPRLEERGDERRRLPVKVSVVGIAHVRIERCTALKLARASRRLAS